MGILRLLSEGVTQELRKDVDYHMHVLAFLADPKGS